MTYTAAQLRDIANFIDLLDKMDPADSKSDVYPKPVRLTNSDGEDMGTLSDPDGTGYFWTPAGSEAS